MNKKKRINLSQYGITPRIEESLVAASFSDTTVHMDVTKEVIV